MSLPERPPAASQMDNLERALPLHHGMRRQKIVAADPEMISGRNFVESVPSTPPMRGFPIALPRLESLHRFLSTIVLCVSRISLLMVL
jgi:hypothetical protein